ncbi:condensation domain-containing protein [Amycolatopsis saalfeldensis]|uniref:Condensation domain-containing protein n=1 Tax=Amycolatopsis saalfeldensis TaxID=394193 RepID=A0A1H8XCW0_9PSEU|nr:condensation domain-containing protein [Amycolatopsis saalfeldensis]SEP37631.1 Condensation domain-containing protein [Amycolatopsis saalfeldensis]
MTDSPAAQGIWYPATPTQQGLWILDRIERLRPSYLLPSVLELTGRLDHELLTSAVERAMGRHPALRSRFRLDPAALRVEYCTDTSAPEVGFTDAVADGWAADEVERFVEALCYTPFELGEEAPARAEVIRVAPDRTLLVLTVHHIVFDGVSRQLLVDEIGTTYRALARGAEPELSTPPHPSQVQGGPDDGHPGRVADVVERLRGAPTTVALPYDGDPDDPELSLIGATAGILLDADVSEAVLAVAGQEGCTVFMTGVALLAGTFARTTGQTDFLFSVVWPGRDDPAAADVIGMFMTTLVLRVQLDAGTSWRELLRTARVAGMETFIDSDVPLDAIAAALDPGRDMARPPMTPVLVNLAETADPLVLAPDVAGHYQPLRPEYSKWDLALFVGVDQTTGRDRLRLSLNHPADLFTPATTTEFLAALHRSAAAIAHNSEENVLNQAELDNPAARLGLVRSIWQEVLKTDQIGDDVSFFDAGGDSLRLVVLVERLSQASGRMLRTVDLFRAGTVRGQAELLAAPVEAATAGRGSSRDRMLGAVRERRTGDQRS